MLTFGVNLVHRFSSRAMRLLAPTKMPTARPEAA